MRAIAVFPDRRELAIIEIPSPSVRGERDVLAKVREVGICGTDREIAAFHYGTPAAGSHSLVLGHEGLGEVVEVGSSVRTLAPGDLVAMTVRRPCGDETCVACRAGRQDFCVTGRFRERGIKEADGFMTELVVDDERNFVRVPKSMEDVGVLVEPLSIAAKAAVQVATIAGRFPWEPVGLRALVLGAGPVGLLGAMMFVARNVRTFVYSREAVDSVRAELVRSIGAEYLCAHQTPLTDLPSHGRGPFDCIFEAVGSARVAFEALAALAPNGVCVLSGIAAERMPVEADLGRIMRDIVLKNQLVFGTVNASRSAFESSIHHLAEFMSIFPDAVRSIITERVDLEDTPALLRRPGGGIKQVVVIA
jgi:threonine dehydrogenase-like Zn-dependent dehydrogenase